MIESFGFNTTSTELFCFSELKYQKLFSLLLLPPFSLTEKCAQKLPKHPENIWQGRFFGIETTAGELVRVTF
jgi:hypothetical protein